MERSQSAGTILELYARSSRLRKLAAIIKEGQIRRAQIKGLTGSSAAVVLAGLRGSLSSMALVVLDSEEEAGYFYQDVRTLLETDEGVAFLPSPFRRSAKYGQKDPASEVLRSETLSLLEHAAWPLLVITYPQALSVKVPCREKVKSNTLQIRKGDRLDMTFVSEVLDELGFSYVDYVYEPGQYAIRGSLLDVFSYASEHPFRVDFFGDDVESIRSFDVDTQCSVRSLDQIVILPEMDAVASESLVSILEYLPQDACLFFSSLDCAAGLIAKAQEESLVEQAVLTNSLQAEAQGEASGAVLTLQGRLIGKEDFLVGIAPFLVVEIGPHPYFTPEASLTFSTQEQPLFHKNFELLDQNLMGYLERGYRLMVTSDSPGQFQRLTAIFRDQGLEIPFQAVEHTLHAGFVDHDQKTCVFTDHQIFDRFHKYTLKSEKARSGKLALTLKELQEFRIGDYVVHSDHGIGRFGGLVRLPMGTAGSQEAIKIVYEHEDVVFVSIHALHKVSKYRGREGEQPRLSILGSGAWEKLKDRTKRKLKDIARELIQLYAARREQKGFRFSPDGYLQHELEASFLYEDTPDQAKATESVKRDMESDRPMDRLVCGDVGFGKTEVAIRAAFKAAADGKQVAVLVPTTVLAYQHFNTFRERLSDYPCRVEYLSRARTAADQRRILEDLKEGRIEILIGTHKLLGKEVHFKDLGLLIVDEEQKFGVGTKEKLRQMRVNIDTLTLTATPIPRTLQFSLMGARDLSVIQTPPPNRYPIQTEVRLFDRRQIVDAVNFEMSRNGQVFYVCNRISSLENVRHMLLESIPDCRVAVGHGQMEPRELERIVSGFVSQEYDVLVSTTIVENGIDIPNANTIIIQDAQHFGLSDLHQMRGRVGRSNRKAFCYLLSPPLSALAPDARRRLEALENFAGLGSGIQIAMQDLDIRGAGNLLGAEQSGFIADLGYETYQKVLAEAVRELKDSEFSQLLSEDETVAVDDQSAALIRAARGRYVDECLLESDLELLIPASYVQGSSERMLLYRELDSLVLDREVEAFRLRLEDRFGRIPRETEQLLKVVPLRRMAAALGMERMVLKGGKMTLYPISDVSSRYYQGSRELEQLIRYSQVNPRKCLMMDASQKGGKNRMTVLNVHDMDDALAVLRGICSMGVEAGT